MKEKLTREEVLHVAKLAKIHVNEEEIEKYQIELSQLFQDIDKIKEIECEDPDILITPVKDNASTREDTPTEMIDFKELKNNIPTSVGNYVEVPVMINE